MLFRHLFAIPVLFIGPKVRAQTGPEALGKFPGRELQQVNGVGLSSIMNYLESKGFKDEDTFAEGRMNGPAELKMLLDWKGDGALLVLVTSSDEAMIPGASEGGMFVIGPEGRVVTSSHFGAGHRVNIRSVQAGFAPEAGGIVRFLTSPTINGRTNVAGFDLAMVGSRPAIIRVFNKQGNPTRNIYYAPNMQLGPTPDVGEIGHELYSNSPVEILEALTWLDGEHSVAGARFDPLQDSSSGAGFEDALVFARIWKDPKIQARLRELTHSTNLWIKRTSKATLKTDGKPDDPWDTWHN